MDITDIITQMSSKVKEVKLLKTTPDGQVWVHKTGKNQEFFDLLRPIKVGKARSSV